MNTAKTAAAARVHERFPAPVSPRLELNLTVWSTPADRARAGGDWCEGVAISEDTVALTVGDVSGHGDGVAGTMASMRASILLGVQGNYPPSEILSLANVAAFYDCDGTVVTAIVAFLNTAQQVLTFPNAGHPPPLLVTGDSEAFLEHAPADLPLGVFAKYRAADYVIAVPAEAMLVFYTDGITEHKRDPIRGERELVEAAHWTFQRPGIEAAQAIARRLLGNGPVFDDAAAMVLRTALSSMNYRQK